jgi:hypothetical protein
MPSLFVRSPWSVARAGAILSATLLLASVPIAIGQQQQAKPAADDKRPDQQTKPETGLRFEQFITGKAKAGLRDKPAEATLEEMLNKALKDNPDIRVAESKVREAEAELNRTRLQVTQKVLTFHHTREAQKAVVKVAEEEIARIRKLQASNAVAQEDVKQAENRLSQVKAKLAEIEAEMPYLLGQEAGAVRHFDATRLPATKSDWEVELRDAAIGKQLGNLIGHSDGFASVQFSPDGKRLSATGVKPVAETTLEKIRKALDTPVTLDYKSKDARQVLEDLEKKVPGISFHVMVNTPTADLHLAGPVSLAAALQLVEDTYMETPTDERCSFAIRDYGILFTGARRIPPGAIQLDTLLKEKAIAERQKAVEERIKKQPEDKKPTSGKH